MIINLKRTHNKTTILITLLASVCMLTTSLVNGSIAYGAEAPAGDENFNYNGYSATQLKKISACISDVVPASKCPAYEASSKDYYTGTANHANMPTGVISTKAGWLEWADAAMKANNYDGVYGTLKISLAGTGGSTSSTNTNNEVSDVRFRLIGINQDNRADGTGKAGLTFQAIGNNYNILSAMNTANTNAGGWRDSQLRKKMNDSYDGIIWNAISSNDFKQNVTPVLKTTTNYYSNIINWVLISTNSLSLTTVDKLWILSPSEMGMPLIKKYHEIDGDVMSDANVHYYYSDSYKNTIKSSNDGGSRYSSWHSSFHYIYSGNIYQWWMLPAGSRKMSNNSKAYHNTDSYSYCSIIFANKNPSTNNICNYDTKNNKRYWLRSSNCDYYGSYLCKINSGAFASFDYRGYLGRFYSSYDSENIVVAFAF